jgi:hypothetical protein
MCPAFQVEIGQAVAQCGGTNAEPQTFGQTEGQSWMLLMEQQSEADIALLGFCRIVSRHEAARARLPKRGCEVVVRK